MIRRLVALVAAWGLVLAGPILLGPATPAAFGHSQLVTSIPAAGDVLTDTPAEIRLVFSEPVEAAYTSLDLLDAAGTSLVTDAGRPDPADPYAFVATVPVLADGTYTVNWQALSAADGHTTSGFFTFGVGNVTVPTPGPGSPDGAGSIHAGHDSGTALLETEFRVLGSLGLLLGLGFLIFRLLVLGDRPTAGVTRAIAAALLLAAAASTLLIVVGAGGINLGPMAYVTASRTGTLLGARVALALTGGLLALLLARRRPAAGAVGGGLAGLVGLLLVAAGGHAAAYDAPAPVAVMTVHLVAVSAWVSGLFVLAWFAVAGSPPGRPISLLVPRFSAIALVATALIALTGIYSDWLQTRSLISLATPYGTTLAVKIGLVALAFGLGAFNFVSGGRPQDRRFAARISLEGALALGILIATGVLASGSPPALAQPVLLAAVPSSVPAGSVPPTLALAPGRPGPTRFEVGLAPGTGHVVVELQLQRLDADGTSTIALRSDATGAVYAAAGGLLPAGSRWDASVVIQDHAGVELSRTRFAFALDSDGVSQGRATPAIDPILIVAILLLVGSILGLAFRLGGGSLPRVDPTTGRRTLTAGSVIGLALGVLILFGGPRL